MEPKRIVEYARMCRAQGIRRLTIGDVTIEIDLAHIVQASNRKSAKRAEATPQLPTPAAPTTEPMDEDKILFWSSGN